MNMVNVPVIISVKPAPLKKTQGPHMNEDK